MWDAPTKKRHIATFEVKNNRNNWKKKKKNPILTKINDRDGRAAAGIYSYSHLAYTHVIRSPMLPLISEWFLISSA